MFYAFITSILILFFSLLSSLMMSYISLATPIGPWMAPILALVCSMLYRLFPYFNKNKNAFYYAISGGSLGGILCVALGSCFPTLYFLNASLFMSYHAQPFTFFTIIVLTSLAAGIYGILLAYTFSYNLIEEQNIPFAIGTLVYTTLNAVQRYSHAMYQLIAGFLLTFTLGCIQQGMFGCYKAYHSTLTVVHSCHIGIMKIPALLIKIDTLPMMWSIGFMSGKSVALPLLIGTLSKILLIDPCYTYYFSHLNTHDFSIAFCSGLILTSSLMSFSTITSLLSNTYGLKKINNKNYIHFYYPPYLLLLCLSAVLLLLFFYYFDFSVLHALYMLVATSLTTYSMNTIAGKIGLAQLGRFATFVMIPGMILFGGDPLKVTLMATFVEIVGGVATDTLFGYKLQTLSGVSKTSMIICQCLGLCISSICAGIFFWILIAKFGLGSETLFAQRAQARALLVNITCFNIPALLLGGLYSIFLKYIKYNPLLVFGGIMMPISYSSGIILGGLSSTLVKNKQKWDPLCSGIFSANSLTEFLKIIIQ